MCVHLYVCVTYFSISLFLQVRGTQEEEEEEEDEGVLGSVLLHSPLLVEGISVNTGHTVNAEIGLSSCNDYMYRFVWVLYIVYLDEK